MTIQRIYENEEEEDEILTWMMMITNDMECWMPLMEWLQCKMMEYKMWNGEGEERLKKKKWGDLKWNERAWYLYRRTKNEENNRQGSTWPGSTTVLGAVLTPEMCTVRSLWKKKKSSQGSARVPARPCSGPCRAQKWLPRAHFFQQISTPLAARPCSGPCRPCNFQKFPSFYCISSRFLRLLVMWQIEPS